MTPCRDNLGQNERMATSETSQRDVSHAPARRSRIPGWAGDALAIAVVIAVSVVPAPGPHPPHPGLQAFSATVIVLAVLTVPLRRRWPVPALAASVLLYAATAAVGPQSMGVGIVAILCAYSVGARTTRVTTLIAGGIATALVALLSVTTSTFGVVDPRLFQIAAGIAVAAALGDSSRSHREFVRAATERAERAEQTREAEAQRRVAEERLRIAQDLHDTVAHQISVISLNAGVATGALGDNPDKVRAALRTIRTSAREVLTEIGDLLRYLRTDAEPIGSAPPQPGLSDIDALIARVTDSGLDVVLHREGALDDIPGATDRVLYRIVQEGLTNAHKHGSGGTSSVDIVAAADTVTVRISNPVSPDSPNQPEPPQGGLGLAGIRERVASVRGTVRTESGGDSFTLVADLPLRRGSRP